MNPPDAAAPSARGTLSLARPDGSTIAYRSRAGGSPGILFLGGFRSDMGGNKALFLDDYCARRGRAFVRFDYFGHGLSSGEAADGTIGRWREDALGVVDSLTQGPQILVGSSMGGWLMLLVARARPARIAALVGIAAAPDFTEDLVWARLSEDERRTCEEEGGVTLPSPYDPRGYRYGLGLFEDGRRHLVLRGGLAIAAPVRLVHGMCDDAVPWQTSLRLAQCLEGDDVALTLVKDGDHRLSRPQDLARLADTLDSLAWWKVGAETKVALIESKL